MYLLYYSLPIIFSKKFSRSLDCVLSPTYNCKHAMCFTNPIYIYVLFIFLVSLSLTASFQSSLKTRIKLHKIAHKMPKNCLQRWGGWRGGEKEGKTWEWGKSAMVVGGDRRPWASLYWAQYFRHIITVGAVRFVSNNCIKRMTICMKQLQMVEVCTVFLYLRYEDENGHHVKQCFVKLTSRPTSTLSQWHATLSPTKTWNKNLLVTISGVDIQGE